MLVELTRPFKEAELRLIHQRARSVRVNIERGVYPEYLIEHYTQFAQRLSEEAQNGVALVIRCTPTRIISREEIDDEGSAWIFDGGDDRYLALYGQDYPQTARFPSSDFELVHGARHATFLAIRSLARSHPPISVIYTQEKDEDAWDTLRELLIKVTGRQIFSAKSGVSPSALLNTLAQSVGKT